MNRQPCQLTIYTHEYDEEGNELDGLHYISYNKRIFVPYEKNGNKKKTLHKKTKSVNLRGNNNNKSMVVNDNIQICGQHRNRSQSDANGNMFVFNPPNIHDQLNSTFNNSKDFNEK